MKNSLLSRSGKTTGPFCSGMFKTQPFLRRKNDFLSICSSQLVQESIKYFNFKTILAEFTLSLKELSIRKPQGPLWLGLLTSLLGTTLSPKWILVFKFMIHNWTSSKLILRCWLTLIWTETAFFWPLKF